MNAITVKWDGGDVKLTWIIASAVPDLSLVTSAHGICFYDGKILMVELSQRGWDFLGGHLEKGETPLQAMQRETMEEGYVSGPSRLFGYIVVDHSDNRLWAANSHYPKVGYQLFYRMDVQKLQPFLAGHEAKNRKFVSIDEAADCHHDWNPLYDNIITAAVQARYRDE